MMSLMSQLSSFHSVYGHLYQNLKNKSAHNPYECLVSLKCNINEQFRSRNNLCSLISSRRTLDYSNRNMEVVNLNPVQAFLIGSKAIIMATDIRLKYDTSVRNVPCMI
jgi:hypothetical protein